MPGLDITSDLTFEVSTPGRPRTTGRVSATGAHVTVDTDDPVAVWDAALGSPATGSGVLRSVAEGLHAQGITVSVTGPAGTGATVGAGVDSTLGRVAAGSRRVRLGRPAAVAPLARAQVVALVGAHRGRLAAAVAGLLAATLVTGLRRRRASSGA